MGAFIKGNPDRARERFGTEKDKGLGKLRRALIISVQFDYLCRLQICGGVFAALIDNVIVDSLTLIEV
jgi:hypothetical protein